MSYSTRHVGTVSYSGSKTVHYPASENGGSITVNYSGTVPVGITINVETDPFDASIANTNASLGIVAGAVAATEVAQVAEISQAGERISNAATSGFFRIVSSELSAQASEQSSAMKSCVGLLNEESAQVERVHQQMDSDYHNIKARYMRIFSELDRELDRRIRELNRPAFHVCQHSMRETVDGLYTSLAAKATTHEEDVPAVALKLSCAKSKQRVSSSLTALGGACDLAHEYASKINGIMCDDHSDEPLFIPVVYTLQNDIGSSSRRITVHGGTQELEQAVKSDVIACVGNAPEENWRTQYSSDQQAIDNGFMRLVESYGSHGDTATTNEQTRVQQMMVELYRQNRPTCVYAKKD